MLWIHIIASIIFVVVLVGKLIHHHVRKQKVIKMEASGEFKKFFKLHFVKVPDNRGVIYYSNGPMNIKYDPSNFDLYRTRLTEIPCYSYEDKKTRRYGRGWRVCYWLIFAVALVCFLLSLIWQILLKFAPDSVEFLNIEALEMTKEVFTQDSMFNYDFLKQAVERAEQVHKINALADFLSTVDSKGKEIPESLKEIWRSK